MCLSQNCILISVQTSIHLHLSLNIYTDFFCAEVCVCVHVYMCICMCVCISVHQIRNMMNKNYNRNTSVWTLKSCLLERKFSLFLSRLDLVKQTQRELPEVAGLCWDEPRTPSPGAPWQARQPLGPPSTGLQSSGDLAQELGVQAQVMANTLWDLGVLVFF